MSQLSKLVEDGGNGSHNPHEDLGRGCQTEAEDPVRPSSYHEAKITTQIVMKRNLQVGVLQGQRDHPVAWANGTKD